MGAHRQPDRGRFCVVTSGALWLLIGCATSAPARVRRHLTHDEAADAALEAASARALRCLGPRDRVTVEGFFDGPTGRFLVERVDAPAETPVRAQACVQVAMERAAIRPSQTLRRDARWTVTPTAAAERSVTATAGDETAPGGTIDPAAVMAVLREESPEAQRCYEDALRAAPGLSGRVEVRFTVSVDGRITEAVASGPPGFRAAGSCILGRLRERAWPAARGGPVDFVFAYRFAPR